MCLYRLSAPLKIGLETFYFCHEDKLTFSDLYGDVEDGDWVQPHRLQQKDELDGEPGDGEHGGDHRDELHHPPLVVNALPTDCDGPGSLRWRSKIDDENMICLLQLSNTTHCGTSGSHISNYHYLLFYKRSSFAAKKYFFNRIFLIFIKDFYILKG